MNLLLERLETRILLAAPVKPICLDLLAAGDSGSSSSDNITNINNGALELIAEKSSTVHIYNSGISLGNATGQGDTLFCQTNGAVVIEAERGTITFPMELKNATAGYQGTGYIEDRDATSSHPENGGTATYSFYTLTEGDYYLHARVYFDNGSENSFFVNIDGQWDLGENGPGVWADTYDTWLFTTATTQVNNPGAKTWHLTVGWHTLEIHGRESQSKLDRIVIDTNSGNPVDPGAAEYLYETFQYTFQAGAVNDLFGSSSGTTNTITAAAENGEGLGSASDPLTITYDNGAATPGPPDLDSASDTGTSNTDNLTNDTTATFTGSAGSVEGSSTVYLRVGGVNKRSATAAADGSYSITLLNGDLAEGANAVDIYYLDLAGNTSADSTNLTVTLDTTANIPAAAPDLDPASDTGTSNSDNLTNDTTPTFTGPAGSVEANSTVWLRVAGVNTRSTTAAADGSYSITLQNGDLAESASIIDILYVDTAGNTSPDSANLTVILDTISNEPDEPDLTSDIVNDTGSSQVDNITNNKNCQITGSAAANGTVHIKVNAADVNTTASDGVGSWSYTFVDGDLAEGANTINVTVEDSLGNPESDFSDSLIITLDTTLATPGPPDLLAASDSGVSNIDNITKGNLLGNLEFAGYADPGCSVQMKVGGSAKGAPVLANASTGYWSATLANTDFALGDNNVTLTITDTAGNTATSPALVVTYDPAGTQPNAPKLLASSDSGTSNIDGITNIAAAAIYGSVAAGNPVEVGATIHIWTNNGGWSEVGTTVADSSGNWSYTLVNGDLAEGTNLVDIFITDLAGSDSLHSDDLTIVLDRTASAPAACDLTSATDSGSSNSDNITNNTSPAFTGTVEANARVFLRIDGVNAKNVLANGAGAYTITLDGGEMTAGSHLVDVYYVDPAGNTSTDSANLTVILDTAAAAPAAAPDLDSLSDSGSSNSDNLTNDTTSTFTGPAGSVEGSSTVYLRVGGVNKRSATAAADGSYSITLQNGDLAEGSNTIDIYYIDLAGNTSVDSANLTITLDTAIANPSLPDLMDTSDTGSNNSDNITAETRPTIQGLAGAVEDNSAVNIWLDPPGAAPASQVGSLTAAADGSWRYTFTSTSPLLEGTNNIYIIAVDPAGNISAASLVLSVIVSFDVGAEAPPDLIAACDTGVLDDDDMTSDTTPTITGSCPAGSLIKIRSNNANIISFTDDDASDGNANPGQWSYTFLLGVLNTGVNTIDFLTIDTNNNTSDWSLDLVITIDNSVEKPTVPDLVTADDSGSNSGDNITNVPDPTITGYAEPGSTVTIDINAAAHSDTAAVSPDGTWSYGIPNGWLLEGANAIFVTATDIAGNISVDSNTLNITLDTIINAPSIPDLTPATDTGDSNSDNITSHSNPRIVGAADPNTTIIIRLDPDGAATVVGTTTADVAGNWSYTFAGGTLVEGDNILDIVSTDIAGNSADSDNLTITIVTIISTPDSLDLPNTSDLGHADDDNITSLTTATVTGVADPNCTIYLRSNGKIIGSTLSNLAGDWSYTFDGIDDLIEGTNIIDAYAVDSVGNISDFSTDLVIFLDTTISIPQPPNLESASDSGTSDTDNYTNVAAAVISGTCESGATIIISLNGNDNFDSITDADSDGEWSYTFAGGLNASSTGSANTIKVAQEDIAGNLSGYSTTLIITLDNAADIPAVPDLSAASDNGDFNDDNLTNIPNATITGTVEPNSSLRLYIDTGLGPVLIDTISERLISSGAWNYTFSLGQLSEGNNDITVIAIDKAGNISGDCLPLSITLDTTISQPGLPDLTDESDTGDSSSDEVTSDDTPTFTGLADPSCHITIRVDGEPINTFAADPAGVWTYTFVLGEIPSGVHRIDVVATDLAGNVSVPSDDLTIWLNVEPTQPAAPNLQTASDSGSIHTDDLTNITNAVIDGKADSNTTVFVYINDNLVGNTLVDANGFWQFTFDNGDLGEGENSVTIITEDSSGLRSAASFPMVITIDTTSPAPCLPDLQSTSDTGMSDSDNLTSDNTPTIEGLTESSAFIDLYLNSQYLTRLTATTNGYWSYTFAPSLMAEGENDIYSIVTDLAGNVSSPSDILTIFLDLYQEIPDAPILSSDDDTGSSSTDGLTNNPVPTIFGAVKPDSVVVILVSGNSVATINADHNGHWQYSFNPGQLSEGVNHIEIIATDSVGQNTRSAALNLTLDTTPPLIYNYFPADIYSHTIQRIELYVNESALDTLSAYNTAGYILCASGGDGSFNDGNEWSIPITSVTIDSLSGLIQLNTAIILSDDTYQLTIDPAVSLHDEAGNLAIFSASASHFAGFSLDTDTLVFIFTIDTDGPPAPSAPQLDPASDSGLYSSDNITNISSPLVHVTADPEVALEVICNGFSAGFASETSPGYYQLIISSSLVREGENLLLARAFDGLGNCSDLSPIQSFTYDYRPPQVTAVIVDPLWINYGPNYISIAFNESNIDLTSALSSDNYLLLASGGDGSFDDGNETIINFSDIGYHPATQMVTLTLPQNATGSSTLSPETYLLSVLSQNTITDIAGNHLAQSYSQQFKVVAAQVIHRNEHYTFTTDTGSIVTVRLEGPGDASILLGQDIDSDNIIEQIALNNTTASTILRIIVRGNHLPVTVGEILADTPLQAIIAPNVDITRQIYIQNSLAALRIQSICVNAALDLVSPADSAADNLNPALRIYAKNIEDNVCLNITGHLRLLKTDSFTSGSLTADSIGSLEVNKGNINADITAALGDLDRFIVRNGRFTGQINVNQNLRLFNCKQGIINSDLSAFQIGSLYADHIDNTTIRALQSFLSLRANNAQQLYLSSATTIARLTFNNNVSDSIFAAGTDLLYLKISGDAIDNLFLAGADLGGDCLLNGINDNFALGHLEYIQVRGSFLDSIAAVSVNPGPDLTYFTDDDSPADIGSILKVKFGPASLENTASDHLYGLLAGGAIEPFLLQGQLFEAPYADNNFRMSILH